MTILRLLAVAGILCIAVACQGPVDRQAAPEPAYQPTPQTPPVAQPPPVQPSRPTAPPAVQAQIQQGAGLFSRSCAQCHGAAGEGTANGPRVIGAGALPTSPRPGSRYRTGAFQSAKDVGMFIMTSMPPGASTPPQQTAPILAYLLQQNGITPQQPINPATAGSIRLR